MKEKTIGMRVRVMDGANEQVLGEGKYVGDVTTYVALMPDGSIKSCLNAEDKPDPLPEGGVLHEIPNNPKILMDSGEVVYGCQVWWSPI